MIKKKVSSRIHKILRLFFCTFLLIFGFYLSGKNLGLSFAHSVGDDDIIPPTDGIVEGTPVHQYIAWEASKVWLETPDEIKNYLLFSQNRDEAIRQRLSPMCNTWDIGPSSYNIITGVGDEDEEWNPVFCGATINYLKENCDGFGLNGYAEHFWDPDDPKVDGYNCGTTGGGYNKGLTDRTFVRPHNDDHMDSNYRVAQYYWDTFVIPLYRNGEHDKSYYWLGRIVHLLTDLTVPAHVHNDVHAPGYGDDSFEEYMKNWDLLKRYTGENYTQDIYKYEELENIIDSVKPSFKWEWVHDQENPPNLFKLFWYTAQKTQYFASDNADGDQGKFTRWDGTPVVIGKPGLWKENELYGSLIIDDKGLVGYWEIDPAVAESYLHPISYALIPHAMKAVAGLYQLFWVETHLGFGPDVADSIRTSFLAAYRGPSVMGVPLGYAPDVHRWGNGYIQDFDGGTGGKGALMLRDGTDTAYWVHGDIWSKYESLGGTEGWLGYPTSNQYAAATGYQRSDFEGGYITTTDGVTFQAFSYDSLPVLSPPTLISPGASTEPGLDIDTTTPTFNWIAVQGADYYGLYISKYPYGEENTFYVNETIPGDLTSFPLPEGQLSNGEKYRWNMRAHNSAGWSEYQTNKLYFTVNIIQPCNYTLTVNINPPGSGTIIRNPNKNGYCQGEQVSFTASPNAGYNFVFWEGDLNGSMDFVTLTMDATKSVTANFRVKLRGDINGDGNVNLQDAILALQAISKMTPSEIRPDYTRSGTDVDGDGKIGLAEVLYVLQIEAELRSAPLQPAISPWPMYQHDAQHTGRSPFIGPQSSTIKWTWDLPIGNSPISPVLVRNDGTIIIALREGGNHKGSLYAVSSAGSFKWKSLSFSISESCCWETMLSPAIGSDGTIYVGGTDKLYALNSDGGVKWDYALKSIAHGPQIVIGKDEMIYVSAGGFWGTFSGILALNPNGTLNWQLSTEPPSYVHGWYPPALGQDGTVFTISSYSSDNRASVEAIDQPGVIKWRTFFDINGGVSIPSVATNGDIYLATGGTFRAFNSPSGDLKFDLQTREENQFSNLFPTNFVIADDDSLIIGVTKYQENSEIMAVNPNGNIKWSFPLTLNDEVLQPIVDANGTAYVGVNNRTTDYSSGKLLAINANGTLKWSHTINTVPYNSKVIESLLALSSDRTLYFISGSKLYAFGEDLISHENNSDWPMFQHDAQHTGYSTDQLISPPFQKMWTFKTGGPITSSPIVHNDIIYIGSADGNVYAINDKDGTLIWKHFINSGSYSSAAVENGRLFIAFVPSSNEDDSLYSLDSVTGDLIWKFRMTTQPNTIGMKSSPVVVEGVVYVGTAGSKEDNKVYAVNAANGELIWEALIDDPNETRKGIYTSPVVTEKSVIVGTWGGCTVCPQLYSFDRFTGTQKWSAIIDADVPAPSAANGTVYVRAEAALMAFNENTGNEIWIKSMSRSYGSGSPAIAGNSVFSASSGQVYALDASSGLEKWSANALRVIEKGCDEQSLIRDAFFAVAKGLVFIKSNSACNLFKVYALNANDGGLVWDSGILSPDINYYGFDHPTPSVANGWLYFSIGGTLYAYGH